MPDHLPVVLEARVVAGAGGGPEKTILNSPRFFQKEGYRVVCAYMHHPDDPGFKEIEAKAVRLEAPLLSVPDRGPWDWRVIPRLLDICRRERVSIWHGHDYKSNFLGLMLRKFWPMRLITTVHGWIENTRRAAFYNRIDRLCLPRYERVICVSERIHGECRAMGVRPRRCALIENGIDADDYARTLPPEEAKARLGLPPDRLVVGAVGRLSPEKGFDVLIRAADELLRAGHDFRLVIAGDGEQRGELQALIDGLGRSEEIRLLGYRPDPREVYQALDVYALSSFTEGLPNVLLEAMTYGVPVVATAVGGVPRLITEGHNGMLIAPQSAQELAASLATLLKDGQFRRTLGAAGRKTVEDRYLFAARVRKVRLLYDELLKRLDDS